MELEYILRMVIACTCGILIGWERKNRAKEAGLRTHCIVACGAALMMVVSKYGFYDVISEVNTSFDGTRIAAQIVSGIGFLGAGMIFVHKNTVTGLTTAAGVWTTAGIGMALGAGMYLVGIAATLIILMIQIILHKDSRLISNQKLLIFTLESDGEPNFQKRLYKDLSEMGIHTYAADVSNLSDGRFQYVITIDLPHDIDEETLVSRYKNSSVKTN